MTDADDHLADPVDAVLLIDLQEGYFAGSPDLRELRPGLVEGVDALVRRAADAGALVVEVRTVHEADRSTWALNMLEDDAPFLLRDTDEPVPLREVVALRELLGPRLEERGGRWEVVEKTRDDAFLGTELLDLLRGAGAEGLAVAGISTESCVAATATTAYAHDLRVVVAREAVGSDSDERHAEVLRHLERLYRQPVLGVDAIRLRSADGPGSATD
ncbi:cysteine hydrolase [Nocardioides zeae]|uniref:Cysteine hydrolase n=1 Tax=Nocardioides imazamoxiresistens TaxID=3231893 RepID=A0ABU3PQC8_9ACTN|nr:cysteine hydrolase [Nocardioides zeae]MDT9591434.1 cysteine hydrolase [Nocardioides zeae]